MVSSFEGTGNGISERFSDFSEDTQVCLVAEPVLALFITWRWVLSSGMDAVEMLGGRRQRKRDAWQGDRGAEI